MFWLSLITVVFEPYKYLTSSSTAKPCRVESFIVFNSVWRFDNMMSHEPFVIWSRNVGDKLGWIYTTDGCRPTSTDDLATCHLRVSVNTVWKQFVVGELLLRRLAICKQRHSLSIKCTVSSVPGHHNVQYNNISHGQTVKPTGISRLHAAILTLWRLAHSCHMGKAQPWASECPDVKNYKRRLNPVCHRMLNSCDHSWRQRVNLRCSSLASCTVSSTDLASSASEWACTWRRLQC